MADEIVVRHGADGSVTVCFGARCVVVECQEAGVGDGGKKPVRRPPKPPFRVELIEQVLADVDPEALDWQETEPGTRTATHGEERLWIARLDD